MKKWWLLLIVSMISIATIILLSLELCRITEMQVKFIREDFIQFGKLIRLQHELDRIKQEQTDGK